jgi:hypothetical protein
MLRICRCQHRALPFQVLFQEHTTTHSSVGTPPHLLEVELLDSGLVRGNGGTLDSDRVLLDSIGGIDGDLVIGLEETR